MLPSILLLGDSIRVSYQPFVAEYLDGKAEVVGPADNCQYSLYTLSSLNRWFGVLGEPDVVHWNNGIHDAGHNPGRSPVHPDRPFRETEWSWRNEEIDRYNETALKLMSAEGVPVNDLTGWSRLTARSS